MLGDAPQSKGTLGQEIAKLRSLHLGQTGSPQLLQAPVGSANRPEPCNVAERVYGD
jgi:hypothetical protein